MIVSSFSLFHFQGERKRKMKILFFLLLAFIHKSYSFIPTYVTSNGGVRTHRLPIKVYQRSLFPFTSSASKTLASTKSSSSSGKQSKTTKKTTPESSSTSITASINNLDPTEIEEWEREELEEQRREVEDKLRSLNDNKEELPRYMLDLIQQFEDKGHIIPEVPTPAAKLPCIAIIGRPNTGKSTLVNKITDSYKDGAIVHDEPGITRDRTYRTGMWNDYNFQVVDTGGIVFDDTDDIFADRITQQAIQALNEADAAIMVCDGKEGVTQLDEALADWLRKNNKKVKLYLAVNKCESETVGLSQAQDFWTLGLGDPYPVSGIHGTGIGDLLDKIIEETNMKKVTNVLKENSTNIAFVGRPNVGKSSLFNRLYGQDRSIVSSVAGTTRDCIDALITRNGEQYRIIDTAGIRKRGKVEYGAEFFMVNRAFKAMRRAEVVVLMLDAVDGIVDQDRILAERIAEEGRSCVIALNKWDVVPSKDDKTYLKAIDNIRSSLPVLRWADVVLMSALTGQRTEKLFESIDKAAKQFARRIPTATLNEVVQDATMWMAPPTIGSRAGRIYYSLQTSTAPPTIVMFCNDPALFTDNYKRYLDRKIRDALEFDGTPLRVLWRGKTLRDVGRAARKGDSTTNRITGTGALGGGRPGQRSSKDDKKFV